MTTCIVYMPVFYFYQGHIFISMIFPIFLCLLLFTGQCNEIFDPYFLFVFLGPIHTNTQEAEKVMHSRQLC